MKINASMLCASMAFAVMSGSAQDHSRPEGRTSGHLVFDKKLKSLLLIDGYQIHLDSPQNHVWKWDGIAWEMIEGSGPSSKSLSAAALDTRKNQIVSFGGVGTKNYSTLKGDTWRFDGEKWTEVRTNDIGTRDHHEMVYADHLDAFVMYGGVDGNRTEDTLTWILKDGVFKALQIPGPGPRVHFGMAYDPGRRKVVLYGGVYKKDMSDDLWEFDGKSWEKIPVENPVGPRMWNQLVYADHLKMIVMCGGMTKKETQGESMFTTDTWGWDGKKWTRVAEGTPSSLLPALGYDPGRKTIVFFGGSGPNNTLFSALWELNGSKWKFISDNGKWQWVNGSGYVRMN